MIFGFAVPNHADVPTLTLQSGNVLCVAGHVAREFRVPITGVGFGPAGVEAVGFWVHVPEAAVNEDDFAARSENEIGFSRQVFAMQAVTVAQCRDEAAVD